MVFRICALVVLDALLKLYSSYLLKYRLSTPLALILAFHQVWDIVLVFFALRLFRLIFMAMKAQAIWLHDALCASCKEVNTCYVRLEQCRSYYTWVMHRKVFLCRLHGFQNHGCIMQNSDSPSIRFHEHLAYDRDLRHWKSTFFSKRLQPSSAPVIIFCHSTASLKLTQKFLVGEVLKCP